jgi:putative SOS response-associated peptidase YedK
MDLWLKTAKSHFYVSGFEHPNLMCYTNEEPNKAQGLIWGLIPSGIKNRGSANKIMNQTLNVRFKTIFEKPSF